MLVPKQWGRIAALGLLILIGLFLFEILEIAEPYKQLVDDLPTRLGLTHTPKLPYRPQDEVQIAPTITRLDNVQQAVTTVLSSDSSHSSTTAAEDGVLLVTGTNTVTTTAQAATSAAAQTYSATHASKVEATNSAFRKAVVMGRLLSEESDWVAQLLPDWERGVYVVDLGDHDTSPTGLKTKINKAKEAYPYLTYIVEHYDTFPDIAVFIHAHRKGWPTAWHNDAPGYDAAWMLKNLQLPYVQEQGYVNLRCMTTPGCPNEIILNRVPHKEDKDAENAYAAVYSQFFNMTIQQVKEEVPIVATPCCAQFAVSKEQVLKRTKGEYERWLGLIEESELDDHTLGTVLEYMWHIMFGREAVYCEQQDICYDNVYGKPDGWNARDLLSKRTSQVPGE